MPGYDEANAKQEEFELLREIRLAEQELASGRGIPHQQAREQVLATLRHPETNR